jgi:hypothetical protein
MKTLQELYELGINKVSLQSSKARSVMTRDEIIAFRNDSVTFDLFSLMNSKRNQIINCLKSGRDFYFQGEKIDVSRLNFLIKG